MADEISLNISLQVTKDAQTIAWAPGSQTYDQSAIGAAHNIVVCPTSAAVAISFGSVSTPGIVTYHNLDSANYVTVSTSGGAFGRIKAGEIGSFRLDPSVSLFAQANTASVKCEFLILED